MKGKANRTYLIPEDDPALDLRLSLSIPGHDKQKAEVPIEHFICIYCSKEFPTSNSLGGHQSAHRGEHREKMRRMITSTYLSSSYLSRCAPRGVHRSATIHKSYQRRGSFGLERQSWTPRYIGYLQPTVFTHSAASFVSDQATGAHRADLGGSGSSSGTDALKD